MQSILKSLVVIALWYPAARSLAIGVASPRSRLPSNGDGNTCPAEGANCSQIGGSLEVQCCDEEGYVICGAGLTFEYFACPEGTSCQIQPGIEPTYCG